MNDILTYYFNTILLTRINTVTQLQAHLCPQIQLLKSLQLNICNQVYNQIQTLKTNTTSTKFSFQSNRL